MDRLINIAKSLSKSSIGNYNNPYTSIDWPNELDQDQLYFTPELLSIYPLEEFSQLSEIEKQKLGLLETVNFFSLNIHGEKELIKGLSDQLYKSSSTEVTDYIHHFLDEENKHMLWFGTFCHKYLGKIYSDKKVVFPRNYLEGEEEFLFFSKVVIFEEIVDFYNTKQSLDKRLEPLIRKIHKQHHQDESRHLSFGREMCASLFEKYSKASWGNEKIKEISDYLKSYIISTWREYYNPDVYSDLGFKDAYQVYEKAWNHPHNINTRNEISQKLISHFRDMGAIQGKVDII